VSRIAKATQKENGWFLTTWGGRRGRTIPGHQKREELEGTKKTAEVDRWVPYPCRELRVVLGKQRWNGEDVANGMRFSIVRGREGRGSSCEKELKLRGRQIVKRLNRMEEGAVGEEE